MMALQMEKMDTKCTSDQAPEQHQFEDVEEKYVFNERTGAEDDVKCTAKEIYCTGSGRLSFIDG